MRIDQYLWLQAIEEGEAVPRSKEKPTELKGNALMKVLLWLGAGEVKEVLLRPKEGTVELLNRNC